MLNYMSENMINRLTLLENYCCSSEYNTLYKELIKCKEKAIFMNYMEYIHGETEHKYSNLYSCVYDFAKKNGIYTPIKDLIQLCYDLGNCDRKHQVHNFMVINGLYHLKDSKESE